MTRSSLWLLAAALLLVPVAGGAASITTNQAGMNAIFSQISFGGSPIDIRFNSPLSVNGPLDILTSTDLANLFALAPSASPTINLFFVDTISWCGTVDVTFVGCADLPGNNAVVESAVAAGGNGAELNAHEVAHNLGLPHETDFPNLMNIALNGNTSLTAGQVATIFGSPLVQMDVLGFYLQIQPILVLAVVPEPGVVVLLVAACIGLVRRRVGPHRG